MRSSAKNNNNDNLKLLMENCEKLHDAGGGRECRVERKGERGGEGTKVWQLSGIAHISRMFVMVVTSSCFSPFSLWQMKFANNRNEICKSNLTFECIQVGCKGWERRASGRVAHLTASSLGYIVAAVPCHAPN